VTAALRVGGATKGIVGIHVRSGGATHLIGRGFVRTGGALKEFYGNFSVSLSTTLAGGAAASSHGVRVTSGPVTASVDGAIGTVTWAWTRTDAGTQPWTIDDPTSPTTTFNTICDPGDDFTATFHVTATDQAGQVETSGDVSVECSNSYFSGGLP
jgi:hypothetical protein